MLPSSWSGSFLFKEGMSVGLFRRAVSLHRNPYSGISVMVRCAVIALETQVLCSKRLAC